MIDFITLKNSVMMPIQGLATEISGGDILVKGLVTMWLITTVAFLCRSLPAKLFAYIKRVCTVSIRIESHENSRYSQIIYSIVNERIAKTKVHTRKFRLRQLMKFDRAAPNTMAIDTDFGRTWFFYRGKVFFVDRQRSEKQLHTSDENIVITTFGFSPKVFGFLTQNLEEPAERNYFVNSRSDWRHMCSIRATSQLIFDPIVKSTLDKKLSEFKNNREWYLQRNIPWKLTILLYGPPGTGKTSLVRYVSDYLERSLYNMALSTVPKGSMIEMLTNAAHNNGVVAIEDFDISGAADRRSSAKEDDNEADSIQKSQEPSSSSSRPIRGSTFVDKNNAHTADLYDMLNSFQGLIPLEGVVTVLTTNHIEKIDPALLRSGRIDLKLEVLALKFPQIVEFYKSYYSQDTFPDNTRLENAIVKGCDLFDAFNSNRQSPEDFIIALQKFVSVPR